MHAHSRMHNQNNYTPRVVRKRYQFLAYFVVVLAHQRVAQFVGLLDGIGLYLQNLDAIAVLIENALKLSFGVN